MDLLTQAPKGTQDLLPVQTRAWRAVEEALCHEATVHGFGEVRTPVFEHTELFQRGVGETTDVVQKEMYTFTDKGGRSVTLRPEGTAGAVRALLEHGLFNDGLPVKLYYFTNCYRYEKPQAGRYREFHQFGAELFGSAAPTADAEMISFAMSAFERLGVTGLRLQINSIGCPGCRKRYTKALQAYFEERRGELCETCLSRLDRNPMRILDCKSKECKKIGEGAPVVLDYLCDDCKTHFEGLKACLTAIGVSFKVDPTIVRGLDYYTRTVFELLGGKDNLTVCGGGRYDGLVEEFGGPPMPALGFALGMERLMLVMAEQNIEFPSPRGCDLYVASLGEAARTEAFKLANELQGFGLVAACDLNDRGLKAQMKYADKLGAAFSMVLGDDELAGGLAQVKNMRTGEKTQANFREDFAGQFLAISTAAEGLL